MKFTILKLSTLSIFFYAHLMSMYNCENKSKIVPPNDIILITNDSNSIVNEPPATPQPPSEPIKGVDKIDEEIDKKVKGSKFYLVPLLITLLIGTATSAMGIYLHQLQKEKINDDVKTQVIEDNNVTPSEDIMEPVGTDTIEEPKNINEDSTVVPETPQNLDTTDGLSQI
ncbi:hypothetical protein HEP_00511300 [Hepatocystis sp. ex Piliocolobus tephrosceles]|nr:hypothetical protein HEP_00511300 [Hepatocystis sp. ex Piliocolobus tephrosceles]